MISAQPPDSSGADSEATGSKDDQEGSQGGSALGKEIQTEERAAPRVSSWVDAAKEKKVLRKYELDITSQEGHLSVEIPDEVVVNANPLWEDFLIGKFLDTAPHNARIHAIVNKIWREGGKGQPVEVHEVDATTKKFRVPDPAMRTRILRRGMWNIGNIPLVVTKWTPDELKEKPEVQSIPMWVYLKNVPMNMFSWKGLSFITSAVGHPVKLHPETASCSNFKVAKIFVKADLSKELPTKINFTKNGVPSLVEFIYPWLPDRCHTCSKWGHLEKTCVMNKKDSSSKTVTEIIKEGYLEGKAREELNLQKEREIVKEKTPEKSVMDGALVEIEEGEVVEGWANVSPEKSGSQKRKTLEFGQVKIATRFSVLAAADDDGNLVEQVKGNELEAAVGDTEAVENITSMAVNEVTGVKEVIEVTVVDGEKNTDANGGVESIEESLENLHTPTKEQAVMRSELAETFAEKVKKGMSGESTGASVGGKALRPSLPRVSKTNHRVIPDGTGKEAGNPGTLGKRSSQKSSQ